MDTKEKHKQSSLNFIYSLMSQIDFLHQYENRVKLFLKRPLKRQKQMWSIKTSGLYISPCLDQFNSDL